jgi:hypothetical protein
MNVRQTVRMDLLDIAHTIHQDRVRDIEAATRRRRLFLPETAPAAPTERPSPAVARRPAGGQSSTPSVAPR